MDSIEKWLIGMLIVFIGLPLIIGIISLFGVHIDSGSGEQTGYVSAVEKTGIIWKTGRAYIKPTLESTQEDVYCVVDEEVYAQLKEKSVSKENITVEHFSWLSAGVSKCEGEGAVIKAIK